MILFFFILRSIRLPFCHKCWLSPITFILSFFIVQVVEFSYNNMSILEPYIVIFVFVVPYFSLYYLKFFLKVSVRRLTCKNVIITTTCNFRFPEIEHLVSSHYIRCPERLSKPLYIIPF